MPTPERKHEMGSGGECICPKCETRTPHRDGVRCQDERCPKCDAKMLRVGSRHYELWLAKRQR
jgi:NAD-dependent SIR2 family protein deacetylase